MVNLISLINTVYNYHYHINRLSLYALCLNIICISRQWNSWNIHQWKLLLFLYSELDSFGSSTVPGHLRINIFVFPECQSIPIYKLSSHFPKSISCMKFAVGWQILIYWRRDHETLDCTASMESETNSKKFTSHFLNIH